MKEEKLILEHERIKQLKQYEDECYEKGFNYIVGVDEVGRGPLAGPVVACALILPRSSIIEGINDSKKVSEKKRKLLYDKIIENAVTYSFGIVDNNKIDEINILQATYLSMKIAIKNLQQKPDFILVDGSEIPNINISQKSIIKGDANSYVIGAASILAKVYRDNLMCEYDEKYPNYNFSKHKGYGTLLHRELLRKHGPCPIHRKTFIKKIISNN